MPPNNREPYDIVLTTIRQAGPFGASARRIASQLAWTINCADAYLRVLAQEGKLDRAGARYYLKGAK